MEDGVMQIEQEQTEETEALNHSPPSPLFPPVPNNTTINLPELLVQPVERS
jgi:hypothetical protein